MSYDIWLTGSMGGDGKVCIEEPGNITYNVDPMFALALDGDADRGIQNGGDVVLRRKDPALRRFIGKRAGDPDVIDALLGAVSVMEGEPEKFRALNPPNGWGDYEGAVDYMRRFCLACEQYPDATIEGWL